MQYKYMNLEKITKENSMFNTLPKDYEFHQTINQQYIYDTQILLNIEIPTENYKKRKTMTDVFKFLYDGPKNMTDTLRILNGETK